MDEPDAPREGSIGRFQGELARRPPPPHPKRERELTPELAERLIAAASRYLYLEQIAAACGVEAKLLEHWLAKGRAENAQPPFADFATRFLAADAEVQAYAAQEFFRIARQGKRAEQILKFIDRRWPQGNEPRSMEARTANAPQVDVNALLNEPPPALVAAMQQAGTVRHLLSKEALQTPEAAAILEELGYSKREG